MRAKQHDLPGVNASLLGEMRWRVVLGGRKGEVHAQRWMSRLSSAAERSEACTTALWEDRPRMGVGWDGNWERLWESRSPILRERTGLISSYVVSEGRSATSSYPEGPTVVRLTSGRLYALSWLGPLLLHRL